LRRRCEFLPRGIRNGVSFAQHRTGTPPILTINDVYIFNENDASQTLVVCHPCHDTIHNRQPATTAA
jgi:hypothetical protein